MRIERIEVLGYGLHYIHGTYVMSGGRVVSSLPPPAARGLPAEDIEGWGEFCPLGQTYLPAFAEGARAALRQLSPPLIGAEPRNLAEVNIRMEGVLLGQGYAKSPLDIACWDILGKATGQPVATLLGGRRQGRFPLYIAVPLGGAEEMAHYVLDRRAEGIHRFQLKLGGRPSDDAERVRRVVEVTDDEDIIIADANGGWRVQDAIVAARLLEDFPPASPGPPCPPFGA